MITDLQIPQTLENEQAVIAAVLDDRNGFAEALQILTPADFTVVPLATAWRWMNELFASSRPVTMIAMAQSYSQTPEWKSVKDAIACVPHSTGHIQHAAATLADRAALRRAVVAFMRATEKAAAANSFLEARPHLETMLMEVFSDAGRKDIVHIADVVRGIREQIANPGEAVKQFRTGFPSLDAMTKGGPREKHLMVIAGKSGEGKTTLAENIICNMAQDGVRCGIFSLEMDAAELTRRAIFSFSRSHPDFDAACEKVSGLEIHISDNPDRTVESIRAAIRLMVLRHRVQVVAVDYLQLIGSTQVKGESRERQVANMSRQLKVAAKESGVLVLALSQLNEEGQLRESRAIEQDADEVLYVTQTDGSHYLWLTKNRHGAKHGNVSQMLEKMEDEGIPLWFDKENFRFTETQRKP